MPARGPRKSRLIKVLFTVLACIASTQLTGSEIVDQGLPVLPTENRLDDNELSAVIGRGAVAQSLSIPSDLGVILWDEKGDAKPRPTTSGHSGSGNRLLLIRR